MQEHNNLVGLSKIVTVGWKATETLLISISKEVKHARLDLLISAAAVDMGGDSAKGGGQGSGPPQHRQKTVQPHQSEERTFNLHRRTSASC
jgi:hypothetical protein